MMLSQADQLLLAAGEDHEGQICFWVSGSAAGDFETAEGATPSIR